MIGPSGTYLQRLGARMDAVGTSLCLGVDPDPASLPAGFPPNVEGVERFAVLLIEAATPHVAAVKANLAFFEAFGSPGIAALERVRARVPPDIPFIADAKRADIGSTSTRQSVALFDTLEADAVTVNPYLGLDALEPLLARPDRFVYVLCRTSNAGAAELQDLLVTTGDGGAGLPLYVQVAHFAAGWARRHPHLGLVCGATGQAEMALVRAAAPELPFLVPGLGAQGGDVSAVMQHGPALAGAAAKLRGGAVVVNVSRAIAGAAIGSSEPSTAVAAAAQQWSTVLGC